MTSRRDFIKGLVAAVAVAAAAPSLGHLVWARPEWDALRRGEWTHFEVSYREGAPLMVRLNGVDYSSDPDALRWAAGMVRVTPDLVWFGPISAELNDTSQFRVGGSIKIDPSYQGYQWFDDYYVA